MTTTSNLPKIAVVIICLMMVGQAKSVHEQMLLRISAQDRLINTTKQWNDQIEAMKPLQVRWAKEFPRAAQLADQYRIIQHLNIAALDLTLDSEQVTIGDPTNLKYQNQPIGMIRFPVNNGGGDSLVLRAPDYGAAWAALEALQRRPDVRFTRARIETNKNHPTLVLENFSIIALND